MQREAKVGSSKKEEDNSQHPPGAKDVDLQPSGSPRPPSNTQAPPIENRWWTRVKKASTPERIFTGVIASVAVLQFVVILFQVSVMKGQLSQMKEGSQLARNDQRAWVGPVEVLPGNFTVDSKNVYLMEGHPEATFGVRIANSGKSPALELKTQISVKLMRKTEKFAATYKQGAARLGSTDFTVLQPEMRARMVTSPMKRGLKREEIELLKSGELIFCVFGHIEYRDIFDRPHFTNFCLRLAKDLASMDSHGAYNEAN